MVTCTSHCTRKIRRNYYLTLRYAGIVDIVHLFASYILDHEHIGYIRVSLYSCIDARRAIARNI